MEPSDIAEMSPGGPLPSMGKDFLPDTSWATDPAWNQLHETLLASEQGQFEATSFLPPSPTVSPPRNYPGAAPYMLPLSSGGAPQAPHAAVFEGENAPADLTASAAQDTIAWAGSYPSAPIFQSSGQRAARFDQRELSSTRTDSPGPVAPPCSAARQPSWGHPQGGVPDPFLPSSSGQQEEGGGRKRLRSKQLNYKQRKIKQPKDLPRMSPQCLRNAHKSEIEPAALLQAAMNDVSPSLFTRSLDPADDYSNLEEITICKTSSTIGPPLVVATASSEASEILNDVWSSQKSGHLAKAMLRPPRGPDAPTSVLLNLDQSDSRDPQDVARDYAITGVAASPKHCQGLPPQCQDWVLAPNVPQLALRSDFSLMSRNIGRLRRSGYLHVLSSSQLSCIASMPGSIAVRFLLIMGTLLGQPLVGSASPLPLAPSSGALAQIQRNDTSLPAPAHFDTANPLPWLGWNPNMPFRQESVQVGHIDFKILLGHLPVVQITLPTSQRRMLRLDRIVDLKEVSMLQHNAVRWTNQAIDKVSPLSRNNFRLLPGVEKISESVEYFLHSRPLQFQDCQSMALAKHGRLPVSAEEVMMATATLKWPEMLWLHISQASRKQHTEFTYEVYLGQQRLLPPLHANFGCHIYHIVAGQVQEIDSEAIGAKYLWYVHSGGTGGQYHVYSPWALTAAMAPNGTCAIFVPSATQTAPPQQYLHRCLILRNGTDAAKNKQQLQSAVALQRTRLLSMEGLPCEARLDNADRSLGPLHLTSARVVQPLQAGPERLLLEASQQALQPGMRREPLSPQDFRPLQTGRVQGRMQPGPTPAALLGIGSALLSTAGSYVVSSVTQEVVTQAMETIVAAGKYRYLDPLLLNRALTSSSRHAYLQTFASPQHNRSYSWSEEGGILLLQNLQSLGHIPQKAAADQAQLSSGLAIVTAAADEVEKFNKAGLRELETVALDFLADSDLTIDTSGGALVYVLRSGSVALVSYYLSTVETAPVFLTHRLHGLPAFHAQRAGFTVKADLPHTFRLTHLPANGNSTAAQSACAKAIVSQEYQAALGKEHPACVTRSVQEPMLQVIYASGSTRLIQTTAAPTRHMVAFLACAAQPAKRFKLHSEVNLFLLPSSCSFSLSLLSKLKSIARISSEPDQAQFQWIMAYNSSEYDRPLTKREEVSIALYSIGGALALCCLVGAGLIFKFKHRLPCVKQQLPVLNTYRGFDRATIFHPHLGPRTLSDFSSSEDSVATVAAAPARHSSERPPSPVVTPLAMRNYTKFAGYTATIRRNPSSRLPSRKSLGSLPEREQTAPTVQESEL